MQHRIVLLLGLTFATARVAPSQVTATAIFGTIADPSGAAVPQAEVVAVQIETGLNRQIRSDAAGLFRLAALPTGPYRLDVKAAGFKTFVHSGIVLGIGQQARVDVVLEIGSTGESVEVKDEAVQVNTTDAQLGRTVQNREILNLPLVNRDVYGLLSLTPGVEQSDTNNLLGFPEQRTLINGSSHGGQGSVNFYLDGGSNITGLRNSGNAAPNPDAVQEFRVVTNAFGAEFGRFSGGVIDVITKSGTNGLHGSAFEFLRNDKLNANSWNTIARPLLRRNQFGATLGGPLRRDKTFFFLSYSGLSQRTQQINNTAIVPTADERAGQFRTRIDDPLTNPRTPFPDNRVPSSRFDPTARRIIDEIPLPNQPNNFYQAVEPRPFNSHEGLAKFDHQAGPHHQISGSYFRNQGVDNEPFVGGNLAWSRRLFTWTQQNFNAGDTWTINPSSVNQFKLTYIRNFGGRLSSPERTLADFGSAFTPQGPPALPRITVNGYFALGQQISGPIAGGNSYHVRDILSITRGRHSMKMGIETSLEKFIQATNLDNYGVFSFDGSRTGNSLADFSLGLVRQMNQDAPVTFTENNWYSGLFFQDDFRIARQLTLNLGLRWDIQMPFTDPQDRKLAFAPGQRSTVVPSALPGLLFPGDPDVSRGVIRNDWNNVAPRLGFAWDVLGKGRTSVRGAAGLFYGSMSGNNSAWSAARQPFAVRQVFNNVRSLTDPYGNLPGGLSPYPYVYDPRSPRFIFPATISPISQDVVWPYTYQLNFSVQHQVAKDVSATVAYVGTLGRRLPFSQDANYPVFGPGATATNVDARRPYLPGQIAGVLLLKSILTNNYHGLQMTVDKRFSRSFLIRGFYTFSKGIEGARMQNETADGGAQNQNNLAAERSRTDNDRKHNTVVSGIWKLDYSPVWKPVLNGWTLSGILSLRSGLPFSVASGRDNNLDGTNNDRANIVGIAQLDPNRPREESTNQWFRTQAFAANAIGRDGNSGRNILDGPGLRNFDLGVFRDFRFTERFVLQFRSEITNALNLVSLGQPNATLTSPAFGTIRAARAMRQAQFGLRLTF